MPPSTSVEFSLGISSGDTILFAVGVEEPDFDESVDEDDAFIVASWMEALPNVLPDEQGDYDEIDDGCFDYITQATLAGLDETTTYEPPEQRPEILLALPEANVASFPQEDGRYLSKLKNVRSDKFSLHWMLFNAVELPSILSIYGQ